MTTRHTQRGSAGTDGGRRPAGEEGFTLIEILVVIIVLGVLAAIVVFALGGVSDKSVVAACRSDAKTADLAVATYRTQNPTVSQVTGGMLTATGTGTLQSWPMSTAYTISISGDPGQAGPPVIPVGPAVGTTLTGDGATTNANDVVVTVTSTGKTYDATQSLSTSCSTT